jgi:hypothetical protein
MKKDNTIFCFDLDNVICCTRENYYSKSKPIKKTIDIINKLYEKGFIIKIYTARYMGRSNDKIDQAILKGYNFTKKQLKRWKIKYHFLIFGKPSFDLVIDDKSFGYQKNWHHEFKKRYL